MDVDKRFDAVIIGAGAAGVSCAIWLARLGFAPLVLEGGRQVGGLCRFNPFRDEWNASLPGVTGIQVADNLARSLHDAGVPIQFSYSVSHVQHDTDGFLISSKGAGPLIRARHVVLATGVTARSLPEAPDKTPGLLVGPGQHIVEHDFRGKRVAVLGGGDNAFENALYASQKGAAHVQVYARNIRAQQQFVRQIPAGNIKQGAYRVDAVESTVNNQPFDVIMVFYGWEPSTQFAGALHLKRTHEGFIATDTHTAETSHRGVYAIGEVAQRQHPCVVTALADGVTAAKAIQARIERGAA
ncbi:MAG TPA: NAD(P)/FAD-dependent oxidoreductase [Eoetvoesiella sp.]